MKFPSYTLENIVSRYFNNALHLYSTYSSQTNFISIISFQLHGIGDGTTLFVLILKELIVQAQKIQVSQPRMQTLAGPRYPDSKSGSLSINTTRYLMNAKKLTFYNDKSPLSSIMYMYLLLIFVLKRCLSEMRTNKS